MVGCAADRAPCVRMRRELEPASHVSGVGGWKMLGNVNQLS